MNKAQFWNIDNVRSFRGNDVEGGEVSVSDSEYAEYLNEIYGQVSVCGQTFDSGDLFKDADPVAFDCGKGDYETSLQSELEEQLENEDSDDIDFYEGEEYDLTEDDEDE